MEFATVSFGQLAGSFFRAEDFHEDKAESVAGELPAGSEAAFLEAFLRPCIPGKRFEVEPFQAGGRKNVIQYGAHGISPVAKVPVCFIADHNAYFSLAAHLIDIKIAEVTDVSPRRRLDGEMAGAIARVRWRHRCQPQVFFECADCGKVASSLHSSASFRHS